MTTYNTGNPIGSTDSRDRLDNSENFDVALNTLEPTWEDRLGVTRDSFEGALSKLSFYRVGTFADGYTLTNMRQTLEYDGHEYSWAGSFPKVVAVGATPSTSGGIGAGAWVDRTDSALRGELAEQDSLVLVGGKHAKDLAYDVVQLDSVSDISSANFLTGARCAVNGTVFEISHDKPRNSRYPLISAGVGLYAIPVENHTSNIIGSYVSKGSLSNATDWALASTRQLQGFEYDNRAGTVFLTSLVKPSTPEVGYLIEYAVDSQGNIGTEVMRSGLLPMGHSDYFAVEYDPSDGKRYVWIGEESTKSLHRVEWKAGATSANIVRTIDLSGVSSSRCEVSLYGASSLLLSFTRADTGNLTDHVCSLSDLASGVFSPTLQQEVTPRLGAVVPIMPHQQRKFEGGLYAGLCGLYIGNPDYTFVSVATESGELVGRGSYYEDTAAPTDEPEGLGWYWSNTHAKLLPVMAVWRPAGQVDLYGVAEPDADLSHALGAGQLSRRRWDTTGTGINQWGTAADGLESPFVLGVKQLFVGGTNYGNTTEFNPVNLRMTQIYDNETRQGGAIYAYGQKNVLFFDGPNDLTYGKGLRWFGDTRLMMHITESGAFFGRAATLAEQSANKASLKGFGTASYPVGVWGKTGSTATAPCFMAEGGSLDYAVPSTEAMQLGGYNASTNTITTWFAINSSSIQPGSDNSYSCGTASLRWSVVYAATASISTSDETTKTFCDEEMSDAVLDAWAKVNFRAFKFNEAVESKGSDAARIHFGVGAQTVKKIFEAAGLDPFKYALLCYDEWEEIQEVKDDGGNVITPYSPSGSRYGIRYEEALVLEAALMRRTTERLESRIKALEAAQ